MVKNEVTEWKCCRACGEYKPLNVSFGYTWGRVKKDGTRTKFYDANCHKCDYKKKNPNARPRRSGFELKELDFNARYNALKRCARKELHPYLNGKA